jgi:hypothetical protein
MASARQPKEIHMNKSQLLRAASSFALMAAISTAAIAQSGGGGSGSGGGGSSQGPSGGSSPQSAPSKKAPAQSDRTGQNSGSAERPADRPKASERAQDRAAPKSSADGDSKRGDPQRSRAAGDRAKDKDDTSRAAGDRAKDGKQQSRESDGKDRPRTAGDRDKGDRGDRATKGQGEGKAAERRQGDRADRPQLSQQKQTSVRDRFSRHGQKNRLDRVNFDIRVGVNVPRNVTLHALPSDVVEIVPEYRNYRYVYVGDQYLIIDPDSYVVVAIIGGDSRSAGRRGGSLTLAADDRVFFRRHVERGPAIRLGIGGISIGMDLPDSVELRPVPSTIVERVPDLEGHRYFFYENEIAIVDPDSRQVVYVIED